MRKVLLENKINEVYLEDLNDTHFIGVQFLGGSKRGFVQKIHSEKYIVANLDNLKSNSYFDSKVQGRSIQTLFTEEIKTKPDLYLFDNAKELFQWIVEGYKL